MSCIFCDIANKKNESKILYEDKLIMIIMDVYPVVDGHLLVIPKTHYEDYTKLPDSLILHINNVIKDYGDKLLVKLNKKGLTLLVNYKERQKVKHYHLHLLPDYPGVVKSNIDEIYNILKK